MHVCVNCFETLRDVVGINIECVLWGGCSVYDA